MSMMGGPADKRRRLASCGMCYACVRDDCGRCINCIDKPKFGGSGVRKQSCMFKRCSNPNGEPPQGGAPGGASGTLHHIIAAAGARIPLAEQLADNQLKGAAPAYAECGAPDESAAIAVAAAAAADTERPGVEEDPHFWGAVEGVMALFGAAPPAPAPETEPPSHYDVCHPADPGDAPTPPVVMMPVAAPRAPPPAPIAGGIGSVVLNGKRLKSARCGTCRGCTSGDCGTCKNCLDKPRFGGPGARKQACMARTCSQPRVIDEDEEEEQAQGKPSAAEVRKAMELSNMTNVYQQPHFQAHAALAGMKRDRGGDGVAVWGVPVGI